MIRLLLSESRPAAYRTAGERAAAALLAFLLTTSLSAAPSAEGSPSAGFISRDPIELRSEDLYISAREVRVTDRYFNTSPNDVRLVMIFRMAEIEAGASDIVAAPTDDPHNVFALAATANGRPVALRIGQSAVAQGADWTEHLNRLGVPLAPHLDGTRAALDRLPPDARQELVRLGLVAPSGPGSPDTDEAAHLEPRWALRTTYSWEQIFPGLSEVIVERRYKPAVAEQSQTRLASTADLVLEQARDYEAKYCTDSDLLASVDRARAAAKNRIGAAFSEAKIIYVYSVGIAAVSIPQLRVSVDKGDPGYLVSLCGRGIRKVSATRFEMDLVNVAADGTLSVLILKKIRPH